MTRTQNFKTSFPRFLKTSIFHSEQITASEIFIVGKKERAFANFPEKYKTTALTYPLRT